MPLDRVEVRAQAKLTRVHLCRVVREHTRRLPTSVHMRVRRFGLRRRRRGRRQLLLQRRGRMGRGPVREGRARRRSARAARKRRGRRAHVVRGTESPLSVPLAVRAVRFRRTLALPAIAAAGRRAQRDRRTRMMRVQVEEIVGLRTDEVVRRRGPAACDADRLGEGIQRLRGDMWR